MRFAPGGSNRRTEGRARLSGRRGNRSAIRGHVPPHCAGQRCRVEGAHDRAWRPRRRLPRDRARRCAAVRTFVSAPRGPGSRGARRRGDAARLGRPGSVDAAMGRRARSRRLSRAPGGPAWPRRFRLRAGRLRHARSRRHRVAGPTLGCSAGTHPPLRDLLRRDIRAVRGAAPAWARAVDRRDRAFRERWRGPAFGRKRAGAALAACGHMARCGCARRAAAGPRFRCHRSPARGARCRHVHVAAARHR